MYSLILLYKNKLAGETMKWTRKTTTRPLSSIIISDWDMGHVTDRMQKTFLAPSRVLSMYIRSMPEPGSIICQPSGMV